MMGAATEWVESLWAREEENLEICRGVSLCVLMLRAPLHLCTSRAHAALREPEIQLPARLSFHISTLIKAVYFFAVGWNGEDLAWSRSQSNAVVMLPTHSPYHCCNAGNTGLTWGAKAARIEAKVLNAT